jgi:hypothetical protein
MALPPLPSLLLLHISIKPFRAPGGKGAVAG